MIWLIAAFVALTVALDAAEKENYATAWRAFGIFVLSCVSCIILSKATPYYIVNDRPIYRDANGYYIALGSHVLVTNDGYALQRKQVVCPDICITSGMPAWRKYSSPRWWFWLSLCSMSVDELYIPSMSYIEPSHPSRYIINRVGGNARLE